MKFKLRDYQQAFCRAVVDCFERGIEGRLFTRLLGIAATGGGKTIIASALIWYMRKRNKRALFLADSDELCGQAVDKLYKSAGIISDLEKAESRASLQSDVVVASIQTLMREHRLERFPADHFDFVIADEAHLSMADGWQRVLKRFNDAGAYILGITATPDRSDGKALLKWYEHVACEITLKQLIEQRHLSPITVEMIPLQIPISARITEGENNEAMAAELRGYYSRIIAEIETAAKDRRAIIVFHPSCKASREFSAMLVDRGHASAHVDGESKDREELIEDFNRGRIRIMNNAQLLSKGYDNPLIDCVICLRLTRSRTAYMQMVGRGTRLFCPHGCNEWCEHQDRKKDLLLLDFLWQTTEHGIMTPACLATDNKDQADAITRKLREGAGEKMDILSADLAAITEREAMLLNALKRANKKGGRVRFTSAELAAMLHQPELLDYEPRAPWEMAEMRKAHRAMLKHAGIDDKTISGTGHAVRLLNAFDQRKKQHLATPEQMVQLVIAGVDKAHLLTAEEASKILATHECKSRSETSKQAA